MRYSPRVESRTQIPTHGAGTVSSPSQPGLKRIDLRAATIPITAPSTTQPVSSIKPSRSSGGTSVPTIWHVVITLHIVPLN